MISARSSQSNTELPCELFPVLSIWLKLEVLTSHQRKRKCEINRRFSLLYIKFNLIPAVTVSWVTNDFGPQTEGTNFLPVLEITDIPAGKNITLYCTNMTSIYQIKA